MKKKKNYDRLVELARKFDKKRWIQTLWSWWFKLLWNKSIRKLFNDIDNDDYYKPVLFKGSFKKIIIVIWAGEIKNKKKKKRSVKEYLYVIMPYLADLINQQKNNRKESKTQLNVGVNFISSKDAGEIRTF